MLPLSEVPSVFAPPSRNAHAGGTSRAMSVLVELWHFNDDINSASGSSLDRK
ncbi:hypothetical protein B7P43_G12034 [Cryptotermes secundus]|uniref:Uncharacterized protein n=1 Tax=Cryptotermes secundus TaxID=105785 RepID=A0A2J7RLB4_9NEOP|nr:hypothetical protein B7P43_G12034 [Cryptotermes secundus]